MDFSELVQKRQSDRKYAPKPVAREHILKCLGTCIMGWFDEKKIKEILEIPRSKRVQLPLYSCLWDEILFPDTACRAEPVFRKVFKWCPGIDAVNGITFCRIINESAQVTNITFHIT